MPDPTEFTLPLPSVIPFVTFLPHAAQVRERELVGAPAWRAISAATRASAAPIAAAFAAHAHAYRAACVQAAEIHALPSLTPEQTRRAEQLRHQQSHHIGAMSGLALALIVTDSYPITRQAFTETAVRALFEAATGETYQDAAPLPVAQDAGQPRPQE